MTHNFPEQSTMSLRLTDRDEELLRALSVHVRLFSLRQVARHWYAGELSNARRRLRQLEQADLVRRLPVRARPLPELRGPVIDWRPGTPTPDCGAASFALRQRWRSQPVRTSSACVATAQTAQLFGGRAQGELKHGLQATHDLGVAQVWMRLDEERPAWADAWRGEDVMAATRRGQKLPDAFIVDAGGTVLAVIEFGGSYSAARVHAFHEDCADRQLAYQMW